MRRYRFADHLFLITNIWSPVALKIQCHDEFTFFSLHVFPSYLRVMQSSKLTWPTSLYSRRKHKQAEGEHTGDRWNQYAAVCLYTDEPKANTCTVYSEKSFVLLRMLFMLHAVMLIRCELGGTLWWLRRLVPEEEFRAFCVAYPFNLKACYFCFTSLQCHFPFFPGINLKRGSSLNMQKSLHSVSQTLTRLCTWLTDRKPAPTPSG